MTPQSKIVKRHGNSYQVNQRGGGVYEITRLNDSRGILRHVNAVSSLGGALIEEAFGVTGYVKNHNRKGR